MEKHIDTGRSIEQIIGYEGSAARVYFTGLGNLVPKEFRFSGRTRRPPKDPFNSLLSLGYTLLMYEIYGDITSRGLNPYAGFLHKDKRSHPTLASDLMEEWRPVIVDSLVMSLMTGREIKEEHFDKDEENGAVYISNSGMRIFLSKFEKKLRTDIKYREDRSSMSFRKAIWSQTGDLLKVFQHKDADYYQGLRIR